MPEYANVSGLSGVERWLEGDDWIAVQFQSSEYWYIYTRESVGETNLQDMKLLAERGFGLNSFIMTHVRFSYEAKLDAWDFENP